MAGSRPSDKGGGGGGGGGPPDPEIREASVCSKNKGGWQDGPGSLPWICHCRGLDPCEQNGTP